MKNRYTLVCCSCSRENDELKTTSYCTHCGGVLSVEYQEHAAKMQLPLQGEAANDLVRTRSTEVKRCYKLSSLFDVEVYAKLEYQNPTGSFKDRGSFVEVEKALELGRSAVCVASTGNMAASISTYATVYGLKCFVFVPATTSTSKLVQSSVHGADIVKVNGSYSECELIASRFARKNNYYLAGDYVFREEGQKSFSYELLEDGLGESFDYVVVPVGCGTNLSAIWKGFREMKDGGLIEKTPCMVAVQPKNSSPLVQGIVKGEKEVWESVRTVAGAVAVGNPIDYYKVKRALDQSKGLAFTVTDEEILSALYLQAQLEGIFSEPSGAIPCAAVQKFKKLFFGKKVLLVVTGSGLKDPLAISNGKSDFLSEKVNMMSSQEKVLVAS